MSTQQIKRTLGLILFCLNTISPVIVLAQGSGTACLPHAPVDGTWIDNGNGKEVEIKVKIDPKDDSHRGYVVARYTEKNKMCRHPDKDGMPVPFPQDFTGKYDDPKITGSLYYCLQSRRENAPDKSGKPPYTISISNATLELTASKDGMKLTGTFNGFNGVEQITFTRSSKADPNQDFQLTHGEVDKAVLNALKAHGITVPDSFQNRPDIMTVLNETGMGVAIPVVYNSKDTGPAPLIVLLGVEALPPCKTINVKIQLVLQPVGADGKTSRDLIPNAGGSGQGDFSSDGLNNAINKALDQANVNQHVPPRPPS